VFFRKDEPYRVTHPAGGDACTTIRLRGDVLRDWLAERDPVTHVACNAPTHRLHLQLHHALASGRCDDLLVEEIVFDVCRSILRRGRVPSGPARASTARDHRDVAHAARIHLHRHMGGKVLLGDVARAVHCSPYHLARIFAREAGMPMHCYLNHLRLSEAVARMDGGQRDLTALALSLGFGDHSHFTNAFKRAFGRSPGRFRRGSTARELRELSKNLQV
jgi:AraC-like DNA-binding protein